MIDGIVDFLKMFFYWVLGPVWDFIVWCISSIFDIFCTLIEALLSVVSLPAVIVDNLFQYSGLPPQICYILNQIGIPVVMSMLCAALLIRVLLNLIPASLTRV